jgi:hypothetical protein
MLTGVSRDIAALGTPYLFLSIKNVPGAYIAEQRCMTSLFTLPGGQLANAYSLQVRVLAQMKPLARSRAPDLHRLLRNDFISDCLGTERWLTEPCTRGGH